MSRYHLKTRHPEMKQEQIRFLKVGEKPASGEGDAKKVLALVGTLTP